MDKRQFLEDTIERILSLDVSSILGRYLSLQRKGSNNLAICPFHNDNKIGSFYVNNEKGIFKCFSCGEGGNGIHFVSKYKGINYVEAVFEIAMDFSLITNEDYEDYFSKRRYSKTEVSNIEKLYLTKAKESYVPIKRLNINVRDKVYNMFLDTMDLSEEHRKYLVEERALDDDIISIRKYRTYPTPSAMKKLIKSMEDEGMNVEKTLSKLPGFFKKKEKESWVWNFAYNKGLLMPIRDFKGRIEAIQIRRDKKEEDRGRYIWLSSTFATYDSEKFKHGMSSGSPIDVLYPKGCNPNIEIDELYPSQVLFITEGRFKSEIIANKFRSTCISVQGVSNWKNIEYTIKNIEEQLKKKRIESKGSFRGFKYVYIAFDSDMSYKYPVYHQLKNMSDHINEQFPELDIYYIHWDGKKSHKGIDDLLIDYVSSSNTNYRELFNKIDKEHWDTEYSLEIDKIMKKRMIDNPMLLKSEDLMNIKIEEREVGVMATF